jgi:hypothetical protein
METLNQVERPSPRKRSAAGGGWPKAGWGALALALLSSCASPISPVTYTCSYAYTSDTGTDTGVYTTVELSCDDYADAGEQRMGNDQSACEQAGFDAGATTSTCTCAFDVPESCDPAGVDD